MTDPDTEPALDQRRSCWSRLTETPMRDLVRGRITGRLDVEALIESAALPRPVASLVRRVVRRTRLWRLEKVDVAKELIAHFRDALHAGAAPERALAEFGDERAAARLIRRAKRRNRPFVWHAWRRGAQAFGVLLLALTVGYAYLAVRYWTGEPKITHDYLADLNAKALAVPPDQAAWPVYREALLSLNVPTEWWKANHDTLWWRPGESGWSDTVSFVRENEQVFARLREAASRPHLGIVLGPRWSKDDEPLFGEQDPESSTGAFHGSIVDGSMLGVLLPHLSWMRRADLLLAVDAFVAADAGDGDRAAADVLAMLAVARHVREINILVSDMVVLSCVATASDVTGALLANHPQVMPSDACLAILDGLAQFTDAAIRSRLESERTIFLDLLQRMYTDDGKGDGRPARTFGRSIGALHGAIGLDPVLDEAFGPVSILSVASRKQMLAEYDRLHDAVRQFGATAMWERPSGVMKQMIASRNPAQRVRLALTELLFPALESAATLHDLVAMRRDAALVGIGLELFRREHGRWPATLEELVPRFIAAVPVDRHVGQPIRFRLDEAGQPVVYSVGNDRVDDGGRLHYREGVVDNSSPSRWVPSVGAEVEREGDLADREPTLNADWILYPPVRTPPKKPEPESE